MWKAGHRRAIVKLGADPVQREIHGRNAFFYALLSSDVNIVRLLFLQTGRIDYVDLYGNNLLHAMSKTSFKITKEVFDEILSFNTLDLNAQNERGNTPLHEAALHFPLNSLSEYMALTLLNQPDIDLTIKNRDGNIAWDLFKLRRGIPESIRDAFRQKLNLETS